MKALASLGEILIVWEIIFEAPQREHMRGNTLQVHVFLYRELKRLDTAVSEMAGRIVAFPKMERVELWQWNAG